jgi:hypothetical protein
MLAELALREELREQAGLLDATAAVAGRCFAAASWLEATSGLTSRCARGFDATSGFGTAAVTSGMLAELALREELREQSGLLDATAALTQQATEQARGSVRRGENGEGGCEHERRNNTTHRGNSKRIGN